MHHNSDVNYLINGSGKGNYARVRISPWVTLVSIEVNLRLLVGLLSSLERNTVLKQHKTV